MSQVSQKSIIVYGGVEKSSRRIKTLPPILDEYILGLEVDGIKNFEVLKWKSYSLKFYYFLTQKFCVSLVELENHFVNLELDDVLAYEEYIIHSFQSGKLSSGAKNSILLSAERLIDYLFNRNIVNFKYKRRKIECKSTFEIKNTNNDNASFIIEEFAQHLIQRDYSSIKVHQRYVLYFYSYIHSHLEDNSILALRKKHLEMFEKFLGKRINNEEITPGYVYQMLRSIRLFIQFLNDKKIVSFSYVISKHLIAQGKRSNEYVPKEDVVCMLKAVKTSSKLYERNVAVFLLLLETGCRPIEICSLKTTDINITESTITLYSKKSGQRKLKIERFVMRTIQKYLIKRTLIGTTIDTLFLLNSGDPITTSTVTNIFADINKNAFGKMLYSPKAFRHTYATNALENNNDFDKTSKSMGHLHWISTLYYLHRSQKRLLSNTLAFDPTELIKGGNL